MKMFRNRKGFTLTELCVVMAITAIIGTMVTTTMIYVTQQNSDIQKEASFVSEVTDIQNKINDWLKKYDNAMSGSAGYSITHKSGQTALEAKKGSEVNTISFSENALTVNGVAISEKYQNVSEVLFQIIEDKSSGETVDGKFAQIKITAKKGSGIEQQTLLFPLFSNKTRERSVTGKNG